jgi:hypothetical protein
MAPDAASTATALASAPVDIGALRSPSARAIWLAFILFAIWPTFCHVDLTAGEDSWSLAPRRNRRKIGCWLRCRMPTTSDCARISNPFASNTNARFTQAHRFRLFPRDRRQFPGQHDGEWRRGRNDWQRGRCGPPDPAWRHAGPDQRLHAGSRCWLTKRAERRLIGRHSVIGEVSIDDLRTVGEPEAIVTVRTPPPSAYERQAIGRPRR